MANQLFSGILLAPFASPVAEETSESFVQEAEQQLQSQPQDYQPSPTQRWNLNNPSMQANLAHVVNTNTSR